MAKKAAPKSTFELRFVGNDLSPENIPVGIISDVLSATQDLASGRDPFESTHVPPEKSIGLLKILRGSARFTCVARDPKMAINNLKRVAKILSSHNGDFGNQFVSSLRGIETLSNAAKSLDCKLEFKATGHREPMLVVEKNAYDKIAERAFVKGETTIIGKVVRVGGATELRCALRVPNRRRLLYCGVRDRNLARRLGEQLYNQIAATGMAVWIHQAWRIYRFEIQDFTQPRLGNVNESIIELRNAGLSAWDEIDDIEALIKDVRE